VFPDPSCPKIFAPHDHKVPSDLVAKTNKPPGFELIADQLLDETKTGVGLAVLFPVPD
jgi:hypothetical protein